jgi:hypothetical protein
MAAKGSSRVVRERRKKPLDDFLDDKELGKVLRGEGRKKERRDRSCGGEEAEQFEVDRLLEHKMSRSGELSLLVKWGGAHIDCEPTWEPEEGVNEKAMEEYEKEYSAHFVMLPSNFRGEEGRMCARCGLCFFVCFFLVRSPAFLAPLHLTLCPSHACCRGGLGCVARDADEDAPV